MKNDSLLTLREVAQFFGVSTKTIGRRLKDAKENKSSFPGPVFGYSRKLLFRREEIESWKEEPEGEEG